MQLSALTASLGRFLAELQRRKVLRVAATYLVGAWVVLQVAVALQTAMSLSASFSAAILALLVVGFPVALVVSWFFEVTPEGIKRTAPASGDVPPFKPQTADLILAGTLGLVVVFGVVQLATSGSTTTPTASPASVETVKPTVEAPRLGNKSIAVLPFANLSADKDDAYLADGLTEETLNTVAQLQGVSVISRTSSFAFKGSTSPLRQIAAQLSVRYLLEGSVRRSGNAVRVTAQLIDATTDTHVWSKTYEPKLEDVFRVQDEIAQAIARALDVELKLAAGPRGAPTANMEAYRLFLRGHELALAGDPGSFSEAIELYKGAIALDPKFTLAHANLAVVYSGLALSSNGRSDYAILLMRESVQEAEKLNAELAHVVLGNVAMFDLRWADSKTHMLQAIEREPSLAYARLSLASASTIMGNFDEAERAVKAAASLDPLNRNIATAGLLNAFARKDDKTVAAMATKLASMSGPFAAYGHWFLTCLAQTKGNHAAAERHFRALMAAWDRGNTALIEPVSDAIGARKAAPAAIKALAAEVARDPTLQPEQVLYLFDPDDAFIDALSARVARGDTFWVAWWMPQVWRLVQREEGASTKVKLLLRTVGLVDYWRAHGWPDRCRAKGEDDFECS